MKNSVNSIAIFLTVVEIVAFVVLVFLCVFGIIGWAALLSTFISMIIELTLIWGLVDALARVERLEKLLNEKEIVTEEELQSLELEENYLQKKCLTCGALLSLDENECPNCHARHQDAKVGECKYCGYQLFPEDETCPNCGKKVGYDNESHLRRKCQACGETISFDDDVCPNCGAKIQTEEIVICKNCGYQLFPEDESCPNCGNSTK